MGWCHEFGPQINDGCDRPMVAGEAACSCPACGVVCTGRFTGCAAVWARGPRVLQIGSRARATPDTGDLLILPDEGPSAGEGVGREPFDLEAEFAVLARSLSEPEPLAGLPARHEAAAVAALVERLPARIDEAVDAARAAWMKVEAQELRRAVREEMAGELAEAHRRLTTEEHARREVEEQAAEQRQLVEEARHELTHAQEALTEVAQVREQLAVEQASVEQARAALEEERAALERAREELDAERRGVPERVAALVDEHRQRLEADYEARLAAAREELEAGVAARERDLNLERQRFDADRGTMERERAEAGRRWESGQAELAAARHQLDERRRELAEEEERSRAEVEAHRHAWDETRQMVEERLRCEREQLESARAALVDERFRQAASLAEEREALITDQRRLETERERFEPHVAQLGQALSDRERAVESTEARLLSEKEEVVRRWTEVEAERQRVASDWIAAEEHLAAQRAELERDRREVEGDRRELAADRRALERVADRRGRRQVLDELEAVRRDLATAREELEALRRAGETERRPPAAEEGPRRVRRRKKAKPDAVAWVEPSGATCPDSHPLKAKLASGLFHLPGMLAYRRTRPDRCYRDEGSALADGLRRAKR